MNAFFCERPYSPLDPAGYQNFRIYMTNTRYFIGRDRKAVIDDSQSPNLILV